MTENNQPDPVAISCGLVKIRKCRWFLWLSIGIYLPGLLIVLQMDLAKETLAGLFGAWVGLLCIAVGRATLVRCPRCGNSFHTNGPTFLPVRRCIHCGLHVNADKDGTDVACSG